MSDRGVRTKTKKGARKNFRTVVIKDGGVGPGYLVLYPPYLRQQWKMVERVKRDAAAALKSLEYLDEDKIDWSDDA